MASALVHRAGSAPEISDTKVVALFDPSSGKIVYVHTVIVFRGGKAVSEQEAISRATANATRMGHPVGRLRVKTSSNLAHGSQPYRIDPSTNQFVAVQIPRQVTASGRPRRP